MATSLMKLMGMVVNCAALPTPLTNVRTMDHTQMVMVVQNVVITLSAHTVLTVTVIPAMLTGVDSVVLHTRGMIVPSMDRTRPPMGVHNVVAVVFTATPMSVMLMVVKGVVRTITHPIV